MENSAGAGGTIGRSVEELAILFERLDRHPHLGLCLDSCHLWVSGVDVTERKALDALLAEVDDRIGLDRLRAVHGNDAAAPIGSNRDRHANIGEGVLGDKLSVFVRHPKLKGLPAFPRGPRERTATGRRGRDPQAEGPPRRRGKAKRSRPSGRSRGTKARPAATRRTRG